MSPWHSNRRELLARLGAGAALLPLLPNRRSFSADPVFPKRLIIIMAPNGYPDRDYAPVGTGTSLAALTLSDTLSPLNRWKDQLLMLAPLTCPNMEGAEDFHRGYSMMFTGLPPVSKPTGPQSVWSPTGPTMDQVIGSALASSAKLPMRTLPLQLPFGAVSGVDSKREALRSFWAGQNQPVTPELNPYKVADTYFAGKTASDPAMDRIRAEKRSLLDFVGRDLQRFGDSLGTNDKLSVRGHLQAVRDIETQLAQPASATMAAVPASISTTAAKPLDFNSLQNYPALLNIQFDLAVAAMRADLTRVVTLQLGSAWGDSLNFPWLAGANTRVWHRIAHDENNDGRNEKKILDKWMMTQFAALLDRLAGVPEPGPSSKTMLDNTIVLWATTMLTGTHAARLPWILAGGGATLGRGQYLRASADVPVNRVMMDLCNAMGVPMTHFGNPDIKGSVPGLLA